MTRKICRLVPDRALEPWTDAELARLRALYPVRPAGLIARELGRSTRAVYRKAEKLGLRRYRRKAG